MPASPRASRLVVLYRDQGSPEQDKAEVRAIEQHLPLVRSRLDVSEGDLVLGRYSVLPFYRELEADLRRLGGRLLNTAAQHDYVADIQNWYHDLERLTPKTWFRLEDIDRSGPFVLKGGTNSRKHDWTTHMYAADFWKAGEVYSRLSSDGFVGRQSIVIRKYVPLVTYGHLIGGLPITKEFRFFVATLPGGRSFVVPTFYWSDFLEDAGLDEAPSPTPAMHALVEEVRRVIGDKCAAYTVDVAETHAGEAIVIELNDLQMAGLCGLSPESLYTLFALCGGTEA